MNARIILIVLLSLTLANMIFVHVAIENTRDQSIKKEKMLSSLVFAKAETIDKLQKELRKESENDSIMMLLLKDIGAFPFLDQADIYKARVTACFGQIRKTHIHRGIDIALPLGTPIIANTSGILVSDYHPRAGLMAKMYSQGEGVQITNKFFHLSDTVPDGLFFIGDTIGYVGSTGHSTGPHIHWELWINNTPMDPGHLLNFVKTRNKYIDKISSS